MYGVDRDRRFRDVDHDPGLHQFVDIVGVGLRTAEQFVGGTQPHLDGSCHRAAGAGWRVAEGLAEEDALVGEHARHADELLRLDAIIAERDRDETRAWRVVVDDEAERCD